MNKTETKQVLDALKAMQSEAAARNCGLRICDEAIALCEASLARVVEPVEEQQVFEDWLARVCPSGDVDSVHAQWLASWDYREWCEDLAEATPQEAAAQPSQAVEPDMFWNHDDAEKLYGSIDEFLNDEICNGGFPLEVGDTRTIQRAIRLPNIDIRITAVDDEECEAEYEVIAAINAKVST